MIANPPGTCEMGHSVARPAPRRCRRRPRGIERQLCFVPMFRGDRDESGQRFRRGVIERQRVQGVAQGIVGPASGEDILPQLP